MKNLLTLLLLSCFFTVFAQNKALIVRHRSYFKRVVFYIGDPIDFYSKRDDLHLSGRITGINDSVLSYHYNIVLNDNDGYSRQAFDATIALKDISVIQVKKQKRKFSIGPREISGYIGVFGLTMVGQSLYTWIRDKDPHFPYMIIGATTATLAQIPLLVQRKKYVIGKKWSLSVIEW